MGPPPLPPELPSPAFSSTGSILRALPVIEYLDPRPEYRPPARRIVDGVLSFFHFVVGLSFAAALALIGFVALARGIAPAWRGDYLMSRVIALGLVALVGYLTHRSEVRRRYVGMCAGVWTGLALSSPIWLGLLFGLLRNLVM